MLITEADEGLGHIAPWRALLHRHTRTAGARATIVCPRPSLAAQVLEGLPVAIEQAWWPSMHVGPAQNAARCWEELLASLGYASPKATQACLSHWVNMLLRLKPDVVLADYAPLAMVAAHALSIPVVEAGGGFCVPPVPMRSGAGVIWLPHVSTDSVSEDAKQQALNAAQAIVTAINQGLETLGLPTLLSSFSDIYGFASARCVTSPSALDHYLLARNAGSVHYVGSLALPDFGVAPQQVAPAWYASDTLKSRMLCYLKSNTPDFTEVLRVLAQAHDYEVLLLGSLSAQQMLALSVAGQVSAHIHLVVDAVNLSQALARADVFLTNGGLHSLSQALALGCPCVLLPSQAEQASMAIRLANHPLVRTATSGHEIKQCFHKLPTARKYALSGASTGWAESTLLTIAHDAIR
jgi:hypothetical protein